MNICFVIEQGDCDGRKILLKNRGKIKEFYEFWLSKHSLCRFTCTVDGAFINYIVCQIHVWSCWWYRCFCCFFACFNRQMKCALIRINCVCAPAKVNCEIFDQRNKKSHKWFSHHFSENFFTPQKLHSQALSKYLQAILFAFFQSDFLKKKN